MGLSRGGLEAIHRGNQTLRRNRPGCPPRPSALRRCRASHPASPKVASSRSACAPRQARVQADRQDSHARQIQDTGEQGTQTATRATAEPRRRTPQTLTASQRGKRSASGHRLLIAHVTTDGRPATSRDGSAPLSPRASASIPTRMPLSALAPYPAFHPALHSILLSVATCPAFHPASTHPADLRSTHLSASNPCRCSRPITASRRSAATQAAVSGFNAASKPPPSPACASSQRPSAPSSSCARGGRQREWVGGVEWDAKVKKRGRERSERRGIGREWGGREKDPGEGKRQTPR